MLVLLTTLILYTRLLAGDSLTRWAQSTGGATVPICSNRQPARRVFLQAAVFSTMRAAQRRSKMKIAVDAMGGDHAPQVA